MTDLVTFEKRKQRLREHYRKLIALLPENGEVAHPEADAARLPAEDVPQLKAALSELDEALRFRVLCLGDFSTGKSSFINRFLLEQELLPAWARPTTSLPTRIRYGDRLKATRYQSNGEKLEAEVVTENIPETLKSWVSTAGGGEVRSNEAVMIEAPSALLAAGIEIVDAPGLNDPNPERMSRTLDYLNQADGVLFFINAMKPWSKYEKDIFEGEVLSRDLLDRLFVIVNYWDQIEDSQRNDVLAYIDQQVSASLAKAPTRGAGQSIPILPISAKTGENAELIRERIWDVLSARKSEDVLAFRVQRFNQELEKYGSILTARLELLGLDPQGRSQRRSKLQQEVKDYEQQREAFLADLKRLLVSDFEHYQLDLKRLFDGLEGKIKALEQEVQELQSAEKINRFLSPRISRLQAQTARSLADIDAAFLERIRKTIEEQKASIGAVPTNAVSMEAYTLRWRDLEGRRLSEMAPNAVGGAGLAGLLLGAGTVWQTATVASASSGAFASVGAFFFGAPAAASSFMLFGVPAIGIGCLMLTAAYFKKNAAGSALRSEIRESFINLIESVEDEKWKSIDQIKANQRQKIEQICANVNDDISRDMQERVGELDAIMLVEDQGAALMKLRDQIAALKLSVNK